MEITINDSEFRQFRELIYQLTGIALTDAKRQLVQARLQRRLRHYRLERFQAYYDLVAQQGGSGDEVTAMINCVTTNKTDFFREAHHFEFIANVFVPEMVQKARRGEAPRRLRVWHAGCSTGEEPYTLAITLREALAGEGHWDIKLFASDIDTQVLAHAERGVYDRERAAPIPEKLLRRYFLRGTGEKSDLVKVRPELRELITFRQINLQDKVWPFRPETRFDLLFCRNVIIYFDKPTQKELFRRYEALMPPGGLLFLGHSESLFGVSSAFTSLGNTIYRLGVG